MRLKKRDKVEVMNSKDEPVSWHVAEILSGNGHTYRVRFDSYPDMASEEIVETVSRKSVRPLPALVKGVENRIVGDIVEVFYEYAWRVATILRIIDGKIEIRNKIHQNRYLVRLHGSSRELIVDESIVRTRQTWHNDKWIMMGKSFYGGEDAIANNPSTSFCYQKMNSHIPQFNGRARKQPQNDHVNIQNKAAYRESHMNSSRSLKRISPYSSSVIEAHNGHAQKLRGIDKDGRKQRVVVTPVLEKVDAVSYPKQILGKKDTLPIISTRYNEMERSKANDALDCSESEASSVGSCSVTDHSPKNSIPFVPFQWQESETVCSDAESCYPSEYERKRSERSSERKSRKEKLEASIRRLEVQAYRRTLKALYASGPLSWEQEAMLTNLRIMLHISNDEHLMEVKYLISAKTALNVR
ncbi:hypothetical protein ABFX02_01G031000 [Erythranthe guttata]